MAVLSHKTGHKRASPTPTFAVAHCFSGTVTQYPLHPFMSEHFCTWSVKTTDARHFACCEATIRTTYRQCVHPTLHSNRNKCQFQGQLGFLFAQAHVKCKNAPLRQQPERLKLLGLGGNTRFLKCPRIYCRRPGILKDRKKQESNTRTPHNIEKERY